MGEEQKREHGWGGEVSELPTRSQTVLERKVQSARCRAQGERALPKPPTPSSGAASITDEESTPERLGFERLETGLPIASDLESSFPASGIVRTGVSLARPASASARLFLVVAFRARVRLSVTARKYDAKLQQTVRATSSFLLAPTDSASPRFRSLPCNPARFLGL